jgi:hypothetical protein
MKTQSNKSKTLSSLAINLIAIFILFFCFEARSEGWKFWERGNFINQIGVQL